MPGPFFVFLVSGFAVQRAIHVQEPRVGQIQDAGVELIGTDAAMSAGCGSAGKGKSLSFHVPERQTRATVPVFSKSVK